MNNQSQIFFKQLERDIIKAIIPSKGRFVSIFDIHDKISKDRNIRDPQENKELLDRIKIAITVLPSSFEDYTVKKVNNVLFISYCYDKVDEVLNDTYESIDILPTNIEYQSSINDELVIANSIVDNDLEIYYSKVNYEGNSILHTLIAASDEPRVKKIINKCDYSPLIRNKFGLTPIDLINDIKISRIFIKDILIRYDIQNNELRRINKELDVFNRDKDSLKNNFRILILINISFMLYFISSFFCFF